jgi:protein MpaA
MPVCGAEAAGSTEWEDVTFPEAEGMRRFVMGFVATSLGGALMTGCQGPTARVMGMSVEGRPIECRTLGTGDRVILMMATIHGDEAVGTPLLRDLEAHLQENKHLLKGRKVVFMPVANPDGYVKNTRENVNGVDLNRNFPAENFDPSRNHGSAPLCEPEARAIKAALDEYRPQAIITIHQPYGVIDYDGPGEALANAMAARCDLPVKRVGSRPGSLGSYAGLTLGIPIITVEYRQDASDLSEQELWDQYGPSLIAAIEAFDR